MTATKAMLAQVTDDDLDSLLEHEARAFLDAGRYPAADEIIRNCDISGTNKRARRRLDAILDRLEMPEAMRARRAACKAAAEAGYANRAAPPSGLHKGIDDPEAAEGRMRALRDYRAYHGRALEPGETEAILGLFDAAWERKGVAS